MSRSPSVRIFPRSTGVVAAVAAVVALLGWAPPVSAEPAGAGELAGYRGSAGRPGATVSPPLPEVPAVRLTHNEVERVVAGASVACISGRGTTTTAAGYLRPFTLTEFGVGGGFQVTAVSFIGADPGGSTAPSYLRAADCGLAAPTLTTDLGRPDLDLVLAVTGVPEPDDCDVTLTTEYPGPLTVAEGLTCLAPGARVTGEVNVLEGAGLRATDAVVQGPVATFGASTVELADTQIVGPVAVRATTGTVTLTGNQVTGSVLLVGNHTSATPAVVSGNLIVGSLFCTGNQPPPADRGVPNDVVGGLKLDQCALL